MGISGRQSGSALVSVNSIYLGNWLEYLTDVRSKLTAPLATIFRERNRSESDRAQAINILALYASDDLDPVANLLMDADPTAYGTAYDNFFRIAQQQEAKTTVPPGGDRQEGAGSDSDEASEMVKDRLAERPARAAIPCFAWGKRVRSYPCCGAVPIPD